MVRSSAARRSELLHRSAGRPALASRSMAPTARPAVDGHPRAMRFRMPGDVHRHGAGFTDTHTGTVVKDDCASVST